MWSSGYARIRVEKRMTPFTLCTVKLSDVGRCELAIISVLRRTVISCPFRRTGHHTAALHRHMADGRLRLRFVRRRRAVRWRVQYISHTDRETERRKKEDRIVSSSGGRLESSGTITSIIGMKPPPRSSPLDWHQRTRHRIRLSFTHRRNHRSDIRLQSVSTVKSR